MKLTHSLYKKTIFALYLLTTFTSNAGNINVMTYNIYMLPYQEVGKWVSYLKTRFPQQTEWLKEFKFLGITAKDLTKLDKLSTDAVNRGKEIPAKIAPRADVFAFQEGFSASGRTTVIEGMKQLGIEHATSILGRPSIWSWRATNSGLFGMSKYPIEKFDGIYFQDRFKNNDGIPTIDSDLIADKGVAYMRIKKEDKPYHIFFTHLQSTRAGADIREQQFIRIRQFIDSKNIPKTEPVIVAGDFNTDNSHKESRPEQYDRYERFLKILNATDVTAKPNTYSFSSKYARQKHADRFKTEGQTIDYVLYLNDHLRPSSAYSTYENDLGELSDHYPVIGHFAFDNY